MVCATHRDLAAAMNREQFRADLYYRLSSHQMAIPPLRSRREDLPLLVGHFLKQSARELGKSAPTPPPQLFQLLGGYAFPGNIRELQGMVSDAVARHRSGVLSMESFKKVLFADKGAPEQSSASTQLNETSNPFQGLEALPTMRDAGDLLIREALRRADGNQRVASGMLGISRHTMMRRLSADKASEKKG